MSSLVTSGTHIAHRLLNCNTLVPFAQLAATLRIAHKGSRLCAFFTPDVIAELHTQSGTYKTWETFWAQKQRECGVRVPMDSATGVEAVNIARLLGYDGMLPLALLLCCDGDPLQLRNGVRREDGTVARLSDMDYVGCVQAIPALTRTLHMLGVEIMHECARTAVGSCAIVCKKALVKMGSAYLKETFSGTLMDGFVGFLWRSPPPKACLDGYAPQVICDKCLLRLMKIFNQVSIQEVPHCIFIDHFCFVLRPFRT